MTDREILQLILDDLRAVLSGGPDGLEQARVKVEQAQELLAEVERLREERDRLADALRGDPSKWSFWTLVYIARRILDSEYPANVFDGSSGAWTPGFTCCAA
jgi:hypothetical protein